MRRLKSSNNFVLQAATRCLRQVPGNSRPARIYLSKGNKGILSSQLEETYGTTIAELNRQHSERIEKVIELRTPSLPPLLIKKRILRFRRKDVTPETPPLSFTVPALPYPVGGRVETWTIAEPKDGRSRMTRVDSDRLVIEPLRYSLHGAAAELAANYHLPAREILNALRSAYGTEGEIPEHHLPALGEQIESQRAEYEQGWEEIDVALALVKPGGFSPGERDGRPIYTARISFAKDREHLYRMADQLPHDELARKVSFHYEGYNFDSEPESQYLEEVLNLLARNPEEIEGVWFTGGLTDPAKTDLYAEYLGDDNRWHRYTPDFVIRRKDGRHLIVEIKSDEHSAEIREDLDRHREGAPARSKEGKKAVALKRWEEINPDVLHYQVIFANGTLPADVLDTTRKFLRKE